MICQLEGVKMIQVLKVKCVGIISDVFDTVLCCTEHSNFVLLDDIECLSSGRSDK